MTASNQQDGLAAADIALEDGRQSPAALAIQRGVTRLLAQINIACLPEVVLPNHRRADLMALTDKGEIWIIEIKSGLADFQADDKWPEYLPYCDRFYFAVAPDFPSDVLPTTAGLIFADNYGAEIMRDNQQDKLRRPGDNFYCVAWRIGGFVGRGMENAPPVRRALGQNTLQGAPMHVQTARCFRDIAVA